VSAPTLRRATPADAEALAAVYVETSSRSERGIIPDAVLDGRTAADYVASWRRRIGAPEPHATWVAERGDRVVGLCHAEPSLDEDAGPETGHLDMLYVVPAEAGQGIGARLLGAAVAHLRAVGFTEATLWVLADNARARRFYEREGWLPTGVTKQIPEDGFVIDLARHARSLETYAQ
jgi:GNAT superfamily N-acetyltransferase